MSNERTFSKRVNCSFYIRPILPFQRLGYHSCNKRLSFVLLSGVGFPFSDGPRNFHLEGQSLGCLKEGSPPVESRGEVPAGALKMRVTKMRGIKMGHKIAGVENARHGKCEKRKTCKAENAETLSFIHQVIWQQTRKEINTINRKKTQRTNSI